jgi:hypothetical protein
MPPRGREFEWRTSVGTRGSQVQILPLRSCSHHKTELWGPDMAHETSTCERAATLTW